MFTSQEIAAIQAKIHGLVNFTYEGTIQVEEFDGVKVSYRDGVATLGCSTRAQLARALFLLALELHQGKTQIDICQKPQFKELGVMLSMQRPLKVSFLKKYLDTMAALGYTYILLYMETSYEMKEYPFFGYMRGKYTAQELKEIDDYGYELGIEVIPCIECLGHLTDYLRWPAALPIKDTDESLLVDCDETYEFVDCMIRTVSQIFRTKRVHLGLDETLLGMGRYLKNHPFPNRLKLFCDHLVKLKDICNKYEMKPMMWSDMPFRLGGDSFSEEYDEKSVIPDYAAAATADVEVCFWDYYNWEYDFYYKHAKRHKEVFPDSKIVFAGGIWVLDYYLMNMKHTLKSTIPALDACVDNGIENVMATIWGSARNTNLDQSRPGLAVFSEYCYLGKDCTDEDIYRAAEFTTGLSRNFIEAITEFHLGEKNSVHYGSRLIWCDILFQMIHGTPDYAAMRARFAKSLAVIDAEEVAADPQLKELAQLLFRVAMDKCTIFESLRSDYQAGRKDFLRKVADEMIPALIPMYQRIDELMVDAFIENTAPFGVEELQIRHAGLIARMQFAQKRLRQYLAGEIDRIEELDQEILDEGHTAWLGPHRFLYTEKQVF